MTSNRSASTSKKLCLLLFRSLETQLCPKLALNVTGTDKAAHFTSFFSWLMKLFPRKIFTLSLGFGWRWILLLECLHSKMKHPHSVSQRYHPDLGNGVLPAEQPPPEYKPCVPKRSLLGGYTDPPPPRPFRVWTYGWVWPRQVNSRSGATWAGPLLLKKTLTPSLKSKVRCIHTYSFQFFPNCVVKLKPEDCIKKTKKGHCLCFGSVLRVHPLLTERQQRQMTEDKEKGY